MYDLHKIFVHVTYGLGYIQTVSSNTSYRLTDARDYFSGAQSNFRGGNNGGGVCGL